MKSIVCITLNPAIDTNLALDKITVNAVNRATSSDFLAAGKGINVASILNKLLATDSNTKTEAVKVIVSGFLGADNCDLFVQKFTQEGLINRFVMVQGNTRQNIKITESNGQTTDINGLGFVVNDEHKKQLLETIVPLVDNALAVIVSGSLPQNYTPDDFKTLLSTIKQHNPFLIVDTSGQALHTAIDCAPFLIKPNHSELEEVFGKINTVNEQKAIVSALKIPHVVVSLGGEGVNWLGAQGANLHATAPTVAIKSTVGAGDTLTAGMVYGLLCLDESHESTLRRATALASHVVSMIGFDVADEDRLADLMAQIELNCL